MKSDLLFMWHATYGRITKLNITKLNIPYAVIYEDDYILSHVLHDIPWGMAIIFDGGNNNNG